MPERTGVAERRAVVRHPCNATCRLLGPASCESRWARIHNVSTRGLALVLTSRLQPGTFLMVELRTPGQRGSCVLHARVVHATPRSDGTWTTGCALLQHLSDELLQSLL
jgi:PilZ domain